MSNIKRYYIANTPVFITAVCLERHPFLAEERSKELLFSIIREVKKEKSFIMHAYVVLDDHLHLMLTPISHNFSKIIHAIKTRFTHRFKKMQGIKENYCIWQRRFWDHVIRNEEDFYRHVNYIHNNPLKHGYTDDPLKYRWSSYKKIYSGYK